MLGLSESHAAELAASEFRPVFQGGNVLRLPARSNGAGRARELPLAVGVLRTESEKRSSSPTREWRNYHRSDSESSRHRVGVGSSDYRGRVDHFYHFAPHLKMGHF